MGFFQEFSIVFFVFLKLVKPGAAIENIIIKQNPYMEGLKITDKKLKHILKAFGNRCLLILDGLDEHAFGSNQDVLRIIKGQKLLSSNIIVTSRPHSTKEIQLYFPVVLRVEGFTRQAAERFASKILSDDHKVNTVLQFNPTDTMDSVPIHKSPTLLSFLCVLIKETEIDLSASDMHVGEIYYRMVLCLYKKYLIRRHIKYQPAEFIQAITAVGKIAFQTLITGNPLLRRSDVKEVGPDAFDYGLLIGHEDAHMLFRDENADIMVTFAHRTIQVFLGTFYFIWMIFVEDEKEFADFTGTMVQHLLTDDLFLKFCLWLLNSNQILPKSSRANSRLKTYYRRLITLQLSSNLVVDSSEILDQELSSMGPLVTNLKFIKCQATEVHVSCFDDQYVVLKPEKWSSKDLNIILRNLNASKLSVNLFLDNDSQPSDGCSVEDSTTLHVKSREQWGSEFPLYLENDGLTYLYIDNLHTGDIQLIHQLSGAARERHLQCLTHLSVTDCKGSERNFSLLFESSLPNLQQLNLLKTTLGRRDFKALCLACNGENKTLPRLTSLSLSLPDDMRAQTVEENLFLLPWLKLECFYLHYSTIHHANMDECLHDAFAGNKMPGLLRLGIQHEIMAVPVVSVRLTSLAPDTVESLTLHSCLMHREPAQFPKHISQLIIQSCAGLSRYLPTLLSQVPLSLKTLILNDCKLDETDLNSLVQASVEGRLPELKHLELTGNKMAASISFTQTIKSLQVLGVDSYPDLNTSWPCLEILYLPSCSMTSLRNISHAIDQRFLPTLRKICVGEFEGYDAALVHSLSVKNIDCHKACSPFDDPFSITRCYCQIGFQV